MTARLRALLAKARTHLEEPRLTREAVARACDQLVRELTPDD